MRGLGFVYIGNFIVIMMLLGAWIRFGFQVVRQRQQNHVCLSRRLHFTKRSRRTHRMIIIIGFSLRALSRIHYITATTTLYTAVCVNGGAVLPSAPMKSHTDTDVHTRQMPHCSCSSHSNSIVLLLSPEKDFELAVISVFILTHIGSL